MQNGLERYNKQMLFAGVGRAGQERLQNSRVLLCGCGALGAVVADLLVRAGVGDLCIVDRDFVELSNLQRQVLFDEDDVRQRIPKAVAAESRLRRINSEVRITGRVEDIDHTNIERLARGTDLILDGTDNFEVRFLINDASLESGIPWIYTGCIGSHGQTMPIFPGESACLRCLMEEMPSPGSIETCDTAGVLGPAVNVIAAYEAALALKILSGHADSVERCLTVIDVWDGTFRKMQLSELRDHGHCPACHRGERLWLRGFKGSQSTVLCGRNAVQVSPEQKLDLSLEDLAARLATAGIVEQNRYLLRLQPHETDFDVTVFRDGRAIIKGTDDIGVARGIYSRYVGS